MTSRGEEKGGKKKLFVIFQWSSWNPNDSSLFYLEKLFFEFGKGDFPFGFEFFSREDLGKKRSTVDSWSEKIISSSVLAFISSSHVKITIKSFEFAFNISKWQMLHSVHVVAYFEIREMNVSGWVGKVVMSQLHGRNDIWKAFDF